MRNEFPTVIERDDIWYIAYRLRYLVQTVKESLSDAIVLILDDRREDGLRGVPSDAIRETVAVE